MARRKSRKQIRQAPEAAPRMPARVSAEPQAAKDAAKPQIKESAPQTAAPGRHARISTCVGGMFITFVLGLYLGSLLPRALNDFSRPGAGLADPARQQDAASPLPPNSPSSPDVAREMDGTQPAASPISQKMERPELADMPEGIARRIGELNSLLSRETDKVNAWIELGNLHFDTNHPRQAIEAYEKALALEPDNADVLTDLGIMYRETGGFNKALDCFRKAISINPRHQNAMYNEGVVLYIDLKRSEEAETAWKRLLEVNPHAMAPDGKSVSEMLKHLH